MSASVHPVDEVLPPPRMIALGLQHVLVMYANAVAVPLILGGALHMPKDQIALLINADLFACGIATLVQTVGVGPFGIRLPVIMGVTAVSISPMLAMAAMPGVGLTGIYGAVIVGGMFGLLVVPFVQNVLRFFPSVVTGSIITMIGISLMRVGIGWAGGGAAAADFGAGGYLGVAALVLADHPAGDQIRPGIPGEHVGADRHRRRLCPDHRPGLDRFLRDSATRLGCASCCRCNSACRRSHLVPCLIMCLVVTIVFIEATGMFLALGAMTGREDRRRRTSSAGCAPTALGTLIGGLFNTFPYVSYSQNIGLVGVTGVYSRWVCATGGVIMLALGLVPKMAFIVASVPQCVLGGAGFIMFGMVAATGIKILSTVDYNTQRHNVLIVAISIGFGVIPVVSPNFFRIMPAELKPIFGDAIIMTSIAAVLLNAYFNRTSTEEARQGAMLAAEAAEHL